MRHIECVSCSGTGKVTVTQTGKISTRLDNSGPVLQTKLDVLRDIGTTDRRSRLRRRRRGMDATSQTTYTERTKIPRIRRHDQQSRYYQSGMSQSRLSNWWSSHTPFTSRRRSPRPISKADIFVSRSSSRLRSTVRSMFEDDRRDYVSYRRPESGYERRTRPRRDRYAASRSDFDVVKSSSRPISSYFPLRCRSSYPHRPTYCPLSYRK